MNSIHIPSWQEFQSWWQPDAVGHSLRPEAVGVIDAVIIIIALVLLMGSMRKGSSKLHDPPKDPIDKMAWASEAEKKILKILMDKKDDSAQQKGSTTMPIRKKRSLAQRLGDLLKRAFLTSSQQSNPGGASQMSYSRADHLLANYTLEQLREAARLLGVAPQADIDAMAFRPLAEMLAEWERTHPRQTVEEALWNSQQSQTTLRQEAVAHHSARHPSWWVVGILGLLLLLTVIAFAAYFLTNREDKSTITSAGVTGVTVDASAVDIGNHSDIYETTGSGQDGTYRDSGIILPSQTFHREFNDHDVPSDSWLIVEGVNVKIDGVLSGSTGVFAALPGGHDYDVHIEDGSFAILIGNDQAARSDLCGRVDNAKVHGWAHAQVFGLSSWGPNPCG